MKEFTPRSRASGRMAVRQAKALPLFLFLALASPVCCRAAVFVIGLDGADWEVADRLMKDGRMPNLASVVKEGTRGVLEASGKLTSPQIWASLATGKKVEKHGIEGFSHPDGRRFTSGDRKSSALWNIVSREKRKVFSVGYLTTWPAERVNGVLVTDLYLYPAVKRGLVYPEGEKFVGARDPGFPFNSEIFLEAVRICRAHLPLFLKARDGRRYLSRTRFEFDRLFVKWIGARVDENSRIFEKVRYMINRDSGNARISEDLLSKGKPDLFIGYFCAIDGISHLSWGPELPRKYPAWGPKFPEFVPEVYIYADALLGRLLRFAGPEDSVVVLSDHGFTSSALASSAAHTSEPVGHRRGGIFAVKGPGIRKAAVLKSRVADVEVAPTVLRLMGLPVPRDMDGKPLSSIFLKPPSAVYSNPSRFQPEKIISADLPFTEEELQRFKSSGYIQ